jgi:mono/diheme cytochrome c family protein
VWAHFRPAPLEAQADPSQPYEARPEWYFMFLFQLLRYFHGPYEVVGTFVLPVLFFLVLLFWPFLDRSPHRDPRRRPVAIGLLSLGTASLIGLTIFAIRTDVRMKEPEQAVAKASPPAETAGPIQRADVAKLYTTHCIDCHGVDGSARLTRGTMPTIPDFTSLAWQMSQTELEITHSIQTGARAPMPAYGDKLSQQEILALTIYVRAFQPETAPKPELPPSPPDATQMSAAQLYGAYCLACHEADGRGRKLRDSKAMPTMPDFKEPMWKDKWSDPTLKKSILKGKPPFMLPMENKLSERDADRLLQYLRDVMEGKEVVRVEPPMPVVPTPPDKVIVEPGPKPAVTESPETASRIRAATGLYRQYCLVCHGVDGRGLEFKANMPTMPDFTDRRWQEGTTNPQLVVSIVQGKGTLMPAFSGRVSDEQAGDLTAYVRAFGPTLAPPEAPAGDFEKRFREVQAQWYELQRQFEELSKPPGKP